MAVVALLRGVADGEEKIGEIDGEVAGGGGAGQAEIDIANRCFEHRAKRAQRRERFL